MIYCKIYALSYSFDVCLCEASLLNKRNGRLKEMMREDGCSRYLSFDYLNN